MHASIIFKRKSWFFRMNTVLTAGAIALGSAASAQTTHTPEDFGPENPFYAPSPLPLHAPEFNRIQDGDYQPAIDAGIAQKLRETEAIANAPAPPTFENTLVAMERSGQLLDRVMSVFNAVTGANTNPGLQKIQDYETPRLAALHDSIYLNEKLWKRVESIYNEREKLHLQPEDQRLIWYYHQQFIHAGAMLAEPEKAKLKELNQAESILSNQFINQLLAATKAGAFSTTDKSALAGLNPSQMAAAAQAAANRHEQGWVLPLQNTTQQPELAFLSDRATRKALFEESWNRAERGGPNDTRETIARLARVRAEKAKLLGYPNYAAWKLSDQMAKTPQTALDFMNALVPAATEKAREEAKELQAMIHPTHPEDGAGFQLQPWDWEYYSEQVRKAKYDLDESQVRPYFELNNVLENGVFYAAHLLYGITFQERKDIPVYAPDVRVFEVFDADGKPLSLFYCDYFKRDNKNGGAWMDSFVGQSKLLGTLPVIYNVANFTKPAPGEPALISFDDVTTMFHEFGHALHGMFSDTEYPSLSGTSVPRDFVELPSQFNEHWALYPQVFHHYARNYTTGEPMPAELEAKLRKAAKFNQGYALTELLAAAELDMQWHTLPADAPLQDPDAFQREALEHTHLNLHTVPPRYRSSYFMHIWGNGYAAGYYAYLWSEMLDDNAFQWFESHGGPTRANGQRFREMILSRGNTEDLNRMYDTWLGGKPTIEPMLKNRGLVTASGGEL
jgi:peptidyl-dipeptidase Dcp